jgi:hypothetical protein
MGYVEDRREQRIPRLSAMGVSTKRLSKILPKTWLIFRN